MVVYEGVNVADPGLEGGSKNVQEDIDLVESRLERAMNGDVPSDIALHGIGFPRRKSMFSLESTTTLSSSCSDSRELEIELNSSQFFGVDITNHLGSMVNSPSFGSGLRTVMEPYLRKARLLREKTRNKTELVIQDVSIASAVGVPYRELRQERPFLFDVHTYPLNTALCEALGIRDLAKAHEIPEDTLLKPLCSRSQRWLFQSVYDQFVISFCIPLIHSLAITNRAFHTTISDRIVYRYTAFPRINVVRPGVCPFEPRCLASKGHSIGSLVFHVPLTCSKDSTALYTESYPGREDWHPLNVNSFGVGYVFDGARCLHFGLENATDETCVFLTFTILVYCENSNNRDCGLCSAEQLEDSFHSSPGYYDEAIISTGRSMVIKRNGANLVDPDGRSGYPF